MRVEFVPQALAAVRNIALALKGQDGKQLSMILWDSSRAACNF